MGGRVGNATGVAVIVLPGVEFGLLPLLGPDNWSGDPPPLLRLFRRARGTAILNEKNGENKSFESKPSSIAISILKEYQQSIHKNS